MELITEEIKLKIILIWDKYATEKKSILDTKGNDLGNIDERRINAIPILKGLINDFLNNKLQVGEFKSSVDSFNKQNNLWGFTSVKGQMFFNLLFKSNPTEGDLDYLSHLIRNTIVSPSTIDDALNKITSLEEYCSRISSRSSDKRRVPNPNSAGYFLSYFWQIFDPEKWPVMYSSMISSWAEIGLWNQNLSQSRAYHLFYLLNHEIKKILSEHSKSTISNWDVEHAFWNFKPTTAYPKKDKTKIITNTSPQLVETLQPVYKSSFDINEYIIPRVAKLMELGNQVDKSSGAKGVEYEKLVGEIFKLLDFEVEVLGQGSGRHPDVIIKVREENTAFLVDAKAYSNGYTLGVDDRAIKEYINYHCPKLQKDGYKKLGFIIVSNSFKSNFDTFINDITWNTEIKRFVLLTSEALLYLLAYKTKEKLSLSTVIESIIGFGNLVTAQNVIEEFDDF